MLRTTVWVVAMFALGNVATFLYALVTLRTSGGDATLFWLGPPLGLIAPGAGWRGRRFRPPRRAGGAGGASGGPAGSRAVSFAVPSTIVVRVRAIPGRPFNSSASSRFRFGQAARPTLSRKSSSPATWWPPGSGRCAPDAVEESGAGPLAAERHRDEGAGTGSRPTRVEQRREAADDAAVRQLANALRGGRGREAKGRAEVRPARAGRLPAMWRWLSNRWHRA